MPSTIHPTALVEDGVQVGVGTSIWDNVHVRGPSTIGSNCIVGEKTYIAYGVVIGDLVKINAHAYICTGVAIEDGVMISAGVIFTNDRFPRATDPDVTHLRSSAPDDDTESTSVGEGATIGSGAIIGPGVEIGRFAMVGMGSVVTADVAKHSLVLGNPGRHVGWVCRCGRRLDDDLRCASCGRRYRASPNGLEDAS